MSDIDDLKNAVATLQQQVDALKNQLRFPIGTVLAYAGDECPPGFLLADGKPIDPTNAQFAALAALLGGAFNQAGDPVGSCRLPDLTNRVVIGAADGAAPVGALLGNNVVTLAIGNMPQHKHGIIGAWHPSGSDDSRLIGGKGDEHGQNLGGGPLGSWFDYGGSYSTIEPDNAPQPISVIQPSCALLFIIKF